MSLTYDRRPSTILREWASPEPDEPDVRPPEPPKATRIEDAAAPTPAATPVAATPAPTPASAAAARAEAASAAAAEASAGAAQPAIDPAVLEYEFRVLQRNVTLGRWKDVKAYLKKIPVDDAKAAYSQMLQSLITGPQDPNNQQRRENNQPVEQNAFELGDLIALAETSPAELERPAVRQLASLVRIMMQTGVSAQTPWPDWKRNRRSPGRNRSSASARPPGCYRRPARRSICRSSCPPLRNLSRRRMRTA